MTSNYYGYLRYLKKREGEIVTFGDGGRKVGVCVGGQGEGMARDAGLWLVFRFLFSFC